MKDFEKATAVEKLLPKGLVFADHLGCLRFYRESGLEHLDDMDTHIWTNLSRNPNSAETIADAIKVLAKIKT